MRPDFGCGIHDYVFAAINASTINTIRQAVREALIRWEPRIEVLRVAIADDQGGSDVSRGILAVNIDYRVRATNSEFNLVYPFFLKQER